MYRVSVLCWISLVCLLAAAPASAQQNAVLAGVSGGGSQSELYGGRINTDYRWGGTAGVFAMWHIADNRVLGLEVNWIQKGGRDGARVDYIEIPFLIGAVVPTAGGNVRFRAYTGIDLAFEIGCSSEVTRFNCDQVKSTEWSWPVGLTIGRFTPSGRFFGIDVRYMWGLSDAFDTSVQTNRGFVFKMVFGMQS